ncbi:hypothetical protein [Streptomyces sp. NPDC057686]|uniref:hypothetical protein n=1 Tax=Streptomyces sp. NPDC057686 TaxID=3346212 RepID=UPI00367EF063
MHTFVVDSNAIYPISYLRGAYELVRAAVDDGSIELLYPHFTIDELAETPDLDQRLRLLMVLATLGQLAPIGGFAFDGSKLDQASPSENAAALNASSAGEDNTRGALIDVTAAVKYRTLVTDDRELTTKARTLGLDVLSPLDFLVQLGYEVDTP